MGHGRHTYVIEHSGGAHPEDWMRFVELRTFTEDWKELGLGDEELSTLQIDIMAAPVRAPVIPATGGLRKLRFSPRNWRRGKRGAARVCYAYFPHHAVVLLAAVYSKNEKDDLASQEKKQIRELLHRFGQWLEREVKHGPRRHKKH